MSPTTPPSGSARRAGSNPSGAGANSTRRRPSSGAFGKPSSASSGTGSPAPRSRGTEIVRPSRSGAVPLSAFDGDDDQESAPVVIPAATFEELGVPAIIIAALKAEGIDQPFPIQAITMRDALKGRDVLGRGRTGSGKTLAFAIPMVVSLMEEARSRVPNHPRSLVLVPTRELATQVSEVLEPLVRAVGMRLTTIFGGVGQGNQVQALRRGVDVVVACPGRLEDLIGQGFCRLDHVGITVLDEADHMADLGFLPGVKRILDATPRRSQRLLFSATLDRGVDVLVQRYLSDPVVHAVDSAASPVATMVHHVFAISAADKNNVIKELAGGLNRSLLFTRTKHGAKKLTKHLSASGIPSVELHGNLSQNARTRNLAEFSDGTVRVLVATDIAARGIHVDDLALVIHVDPPTEHKAYLHRSGRTARAGAEGTVVTLMTPDQVSATKQLTKAAGIHPITTQVVPGHPVIRDLAGEAAPYQAPKPPAPEPAQNQGPSNRAKRGPSAGRAASSGGPRSGSGGGSGGGGRSDSGRSEKGRVELGRVEFGRPDGSPRSDSGRPAGTGGSSTGRSQGGRPGGAGGSSSGGSGRPGGSSGRPGGSGGGASRGGSGAGSGRSGGSRSR
jgi:superfamily II DNA/RNA helicase